MTSNPITAVIAEPFSVELEPTPPPPEPGEGEFIFQTAYSLISPGTELALYTGTHTGLKDPANKFAKYPFHPGYAAVGHVLQSGEAMPSTSPDTYYLAAIPHSTQICTSLVKAMFLLPVPKGLAPQRAGFARLAAIAATALAVAPVEPGQRVAVLGAGLIGNFAAQHFQRAQARVVVIETSETRREIAGNCGLFAVSQPTDVIATLGGQFDIVVEATGVPALVNASLEMACRRGRVVLLGSPRGLTEIDAYRHIHARGVQMLGAHEALQGFDGLPTRTELVRQSLEAIAAEEIKVEPLLTHLLPAACIKQAYEMLTHQRDGAMGVVLDWQ